MDIENRSDIELMVDAFYKKVLADKQLGFIFQDVAKVNWSTHIPLLYDFWENVIFFTGSYEGNPVNLHKHLHAIEPLSKAHFDRWNKLFILTVDQLFEGSKAELAKERAICISGIIRDKVFEYQKTTKDIRSGVPRNNIKKNRKRSQA
ncbi:group III truncated hemoglobin [Daejeonella sp.]|uniref:group III truncated hemoglobin n=1 Tax=Daejeonella sp. TaxID=2805397 RepID=UPI0026B5D8D9|nr:group III truncated hemoglobin [Daejeonella sp.]HQT23673.1 group III truncated hemoglobin [Daejeonella sp.]HQT58384.1 group III truncated hemoglobin [Daejeonella sp.]